MTWVAAGVAVVGAGVSADAAHDAANKQSAGTNAAIAVQNAQFGTTRADQAPYRASGTAGLNQLRGMLGLAPPQTDLAGASLIDLSGGAPAPNSDLYQSNPAYRKAWDDVANIHQSGFHSAYTTNSDPKWIEAQLRERLAGNPDNGFAAAGTAPGASPATSPDQSPLLRKFSVADFWNDPVTQLSYQSGLDLGTKAMRNAAPLTTGLDSGAGVKELTKFGTDYTGMKAGDAYTRFTGDQTSQFNRLAALAGIGQTANQAVAGAGANTSNNVAALYAGQGNANAAAGIAQGNAYGGALSSISNWWQQQQMIKNLRGSGGTGTYVGPLGYNPQPE